jgi:hypothetical protein
VIRDAMTNVGEGLHGEEVFVRRNTFLPETVKMKDPARGGGMESCITT